MNSSHEMTHSRLIQQMAEEIHPMEEYQPQIMDEHMQTLEDNRLQYLVMQKPLAQSQVLALQQQPSLQALYNEFQNEQLYGTIKRSNEYGSKTEFNVSIKRDPMMFEENSSVQFQINAALSDNKYQSAISIDSQNLHSQSFNKNQGNFYCSPYGYSKC